jgi:hypothetical protein
MICIGFWWAVNIEKRTNFFSLIVKVEKSKSDYHMACKNEKTAINQERNANADSSLSQDQVDS